MRSTACYNDEAKHRSSFENLPTENISHDHQLSFFTMQPNEKDTIKPFLKGSLGIGKLV